MRGGTASVPSIISDNQPSAAWASRERTKSVRQRSEFPWINANSNRGNSIWGSFLVIFALFMNVLKVAYLYLDYKFQ